jgi:hypothetical protein
MSLFDSASLVVTPNGYKEDKLYSIKPTDGSGDLIVTRATTATRVNSAGLVEVVPRNLLTYSNTFTDASWLKGNVTLTANAIANPINGIVDAYRVNITSTGVTNLFQEVVKGGGNYTVSVFVKKAETQYVNLGFIYNAGRWSGTQFDLNSGTILRNNAFTYTFVNSTITNLGNGWFKLTHTATTDTNEAYPFSSPSNAIWSSGEPRQTLTGNNTTGAYFFGMQTELFSTATEYFPTTDRLNVPRIDYTNGSCPSILVEPQRTNLALKSEEFDTPWILGANLTISSSTQTSPSGLNNSKKATNTLNNGAVQFYQLCTTSSNTYTYSIYVKNDTNRYFSSSLTSGATASNRYVVFFDLQNGTVYQVYNTAIPLTNTSNKIESVGNGWYRCTITATCDTLVYVVNQSTNNGTLALNLNGDLTNATTGSVYIWGAQLEAGSYPTSYIPTVASSVTRNADVISKTGISSLIGQTEGTVFINVKNNSIDSTTKMILKLWDGTDNNRIQLSTFGDVFFFFVSTGGAIQINLNYAPPILTNNKYKVAIKYANNSYKVFINGANVITNTSLSVPSTSALVFGNNGLGGLFNSINIDSTQLYKTALTDAECIALTTL